MKPLTCIALYVAVAFPALAEPTTARQIMEAQSDRHRIRHETTAMKIILTDSKGFREERMLKRLESNAGAQSVKSLSVFDAPEDIEGAALLTWQHAGKPNDQWIYFPSQRRLQRIAQSRRSSYFMGTDFTYEDMDPEEIDAYAYRFLDHQTIDEQDCHVIEAVPATAAMARASGYARRNLYIRKDILFTIRIEFYDRHGTLVKTQRNSGLVNIAGDLWRANQAFVDNLAKEHQTEVVVESRDTQSELPDDVFSERHVLTGRYRN